MGPPFPFLRGAGKALLCQCSKDFFSVLQLCIIMPIEFWSSAFLGDVPFRKSFLGATVG